MEYLPLDSTKNEIRVLALHPPSETTSGLIECSLEHVSLDDYSDQYRTFLRLDGSNKPHRFRSTLWGAVTTHDVNFEEIDSLHPSSVMDDLANNFSYDPIYYNNSFRYAKVYDWGHLYALSYEWGGTITTAEILVNGHRVAVTKNLHDALQNLLPSWHRETRETVSARLWVDALCINQQNVPERNNQLQLMEQIYSTATSVFVRLGPELECGHDRETANMLEKPGCKEVLRTDDDFNAWSGVFELSCRSYWRRLWIIQEVFLANGRARIYFGRQFGNLSSLFRTLLIFQPEPAVYLLRGENIRSLISISRSANNFDILLLLDAGRGAEQTDIRDKIYGLLALMDSEIRTYVMPDYLLSAATVYRNFAIAFIKFTGKLRITYQTLSNSGGILQLPSWVPDWTSDPQDYDITQDLLNAAEYMKTAFAPRDWAHTFRESGNPNHLLCRGFQLDRVASLGCRDSRRHKDHDAVDSRMESSDKSVYGSRDGAKMAIWDAISYGRSKEVETETMVYLLNIPYFDGREQEDRLLKTMNRFQQCNKDLLVEGERLSSYFPPWTDHYASTTNDLTNDLVFDEIRISLAFVLLFRRFIVTQRGFVGMALPSVKTGDGIFAVEGCDVPLLLRRKEDNTYDVVGYCYVSGLMHGEVIKGFKAGEYQMTDIILS